MTFVDDLLKRLEAAQGDTRAQAAVAAEFILVAQPEAERGPLRAALDAAAVLRWFDVRLLAAVLEVPEEGAARWLRTLEAMPFVERYRMGERDLRNVHESTRLGWRRQLAHEAPERFRALSARAAACFATDSTRFGRIEWIYHRLGADPAGGASDLEKLDREWTSGARPEDRYGLAAALRELEDTGLVQGRARAWVLMVTAWTRDSRGETAQLMDEASEAVRLARAAGDRRAEADASGLLGDVFLTQGKLAEAQAAFGRYLALSLLLAEEEPDNAGWQRELGVAHMRMGDALKERGQLTEAQAAYGQSLAIIRRLAEQDPRHPGRQRELGAAHSRIGVVLEAQGKLPGAQGMYEQDLEISRRLAERDPSNADWQQGLAVAHSRMGDAFVAQGQFAEAQDALGQNLAILRRLSEQDPSNAAWRRELGVAHGKVGDLLQAQGKLPEAQAAHAEGLAAIRTLAEQDPSNTVWQRDLALAWLRVARLRSAEGRHDAALPLYEEASGILGALVERAPGFTQWAQDKSIVDGELELCRTRQEGGKA